MEIVLIKDNVPFDCMILKYHMYADSLDLDLNQIPILITKLINHIKSKAAYRLKSDIPLLSSSIV